MIHPYRRMARLNILSVGPRCEKKKYVSCKKQDDLPDDLRKIPVVQTALIRQKRVQARSYHPSAEKNRYGDSLSATQIPSPEWPHRVGEFFGIAMCPTHWGLNYGGDTQQRKQEHPPYGR